VGVVEAEEMGRRARRWKCRCIRCELGRQHAAKRQQSPVDATIEDDIFYEPEDNGRWAMAGIEYDATRKIINVGRVT
jgi:hypothetical protein